MPGFCCSRAPGLCNETCVSAGLLQRRRRLLQPPAACPSCCSDARRDGQKSDYLLHCPVLEAAHGVLQPPHLSDMRFSSEHDRAGGLFFHPMPCKRVNSSTHPVLESARGSNMQSSNPQQVTGKYTEDTNTNSPIQNNLMSMMVMLMLPLPLLLLHSCSYLLLLLG